MTHAVKFIAETDDAYTIGGYGVVFGGRDLMGDYFTAETDFWTDRITSTPPVLYEHGRDGATRKNVLGAVVSMKSDDTGLWIEAQLQKSRKYVSAVMELVKQGVLGWSSGAVSHLVEQTKSGHLAVWPIAEFSLTPNPCEPRTIGVQDLSDVESEPEVKSMLDAMKAVEQKSMSGYPEGSYERLIERLEGMARGSMLMSGERDCYGWIVATFSDHFIYRHEHDEYYSITYSVSDDGEPVLGAWTEVETAFVPVNESEMDMEAMPIAMATASLVKMTSALVQRTKDLHARRSAEGRRLSDRNVETIDYLVHQLQTAAVELEDLTTDESEQGTKGQVSDGMIRQRLRITRAAYELSGLLAS